MAPLDEDYECGSWPETLDQTRLGGMMRHGWHEDDELDEPDTGIEDDPHDALDEDGF